MTMRTGQMRHSVDILARSTTQDSAGQTMNNWTVFATRRAAQDRTPGSEVFSAGTRNARVPTVWRLRWLDGVRPGMRVRHGTNLYNIISAVPDPNKEELVIASELLVDET